MDVPGDTLVCRGTVVEKDDANGTVRCEITLENGEGRVTTTGEAVVELPRGAAAKIGWRRLRQCGALPTRRT